MGKVRGFTGKDDRSPKGRGPHGWEGDSPHDQREDRGVSEHDDLRDDFEHSLRHRELTKDGDLRVGSEYGRPAGYEDVSKSESGQRVRPYEERVQRASIAGVLVRSATDTDDDNLHFARNKYMERGAKTGAVRPWKPKGREAAERASRDV